jgi:ketosteroid isomerase-like protein
MRRFAGNGLRMRASGLVLGLALTLAVLPVAAQKNKNKKNQAPAPTAQADLSSLMPPLTDSQAVDKAVGEMLGYWQIGDIDSLHKYYDDNVVIVSGAFEPPIIGWDNFVRDYKAQRASAPIGRMDRSNTVIKVNGDFAWATYQFVYTAVTETKIAIFRGHTTLILNKRGDRWVIVLNHSSIVDSNTTPSSPASSAPSAKP